MNSNLHPPGAAPATAIRIRPLRPDDLDRMIEFAQGLSAQTLYQRFQCVRRLTTAQVGQLVAVDWRREVAIVAALTEHSRERCIGAARAVDTGAPGEAEFAITVADEWQRQGLGQLLLHALIDAANRRGTVRMVGTTFSGNTPMLALARRFGFGSTREPGAAMYTQLKLDLPLIAIAATTA